VFVYILHSANGAEFGVVEIVGAKTVIMVWTDNKVFKLIKLYDSNSSTLELATDPRLGPQLASFCQL